MKEAVMKITADYGSHKAEYLIDAKKNVIYVLSDVVTDDKDISPVVKYDSSSNVYSLIDDYREGRINNWNKALLAFTCPEWLTEEDLKELNNSDVACWLSHPNWWKSFKKISQLFANS